MGNQDVKINLDLVPESQHLRLAGLFFAAMQEFLTILKTRPSSSNGKLSKARKEGHHDG